MDRDIGFTADDLQLVDSGGTVDVTGDQQDFLSVTAQFQSQFTGGGGFTAAVETDQHNDSGFAAGCQLCGTAAEQFHELIVDDLDDLLTGGHAFDDLLTDALTADGLNKFADDLQIDVGFQQGQTDFPHGFCDVLVGQGTLTPQLPEDIMQLVTQRVEHFFFFSLY